jgi:hypothetical protein
MMKVEVWGTVHRTPRSYRIWVGEMAAIPREGEMLEVIEGWGALTVKSVCWTLPSGSVEIRAEINEGDEWPEV